MSLLLSDMTKVSVWMRYKLTCENSDIDAVCLSNFKAIWSALTPQFVITKPATDLCWTCQQNNTLVFRYNINTLAPESVLITSALSFSMHHCKSFFLIQKFKLHRRREDLSSFSTTTAPQTCQRSLKPVQKSQVGC